MSDNYKEDIPIITPDQCPQKVIEWQKKFNLEREKVVTDKLDGMYHLLMKIDSRQVNSSILVKAAFVIAVFAFSISVSTCARVDQPFTSFKKTERYMDVPKQPQDGVLTYKYKNNE